MDMDKAYAIDEEKAREGVPMYLDVEKKEFFMIRRTPNAEYTRDLGKEWRRHEKIIEHTTDEEKAEKLSQDILAGVLARTVLVGWAGITVKGKKLTYSVENAKKLLIDYPIFREQIAEFARDYTNYRPEESVEDIKK